MLSAIQIAGFLNLLSLQNKSMKQPHFYHVDSNSLSLSLSYWVGMVKSGPVWTRDSKTYT